MKQLYKTLPQSNMQDLSPKNFYDSIKKDAMANKHQRKQSIEKAKTDTIEICIRKFPYIFVALLVCWVLCAIFNMFEIKQGVETALNVTMNLFLGGLIGKYVV